MRQYLLVLVLLPVCGWGASSREAASAERRTGGSELVLCSPVPFNVLFPARAVLQSTSNPGSARVCRTLTARSSSGLQQRPATQRGKSGMPTVSECPHGGRWPSASVASVAAAGAAVGLAAIHVGTYGISHARALALPEAKAGLSKCYICKQARQSLHTSGQRQLGLSTSLAGSTGTHSLLPGPASKSLFPQLQPPCPLLQSHVMNSVVKVYTQHSRPNYSNPWQRQRQSASYASGLLAEGPRGERWVLTNAHAVEYYSQVSRSLFKQLRAVAGRFRAAQPYAQPNAMQPALLLVAAHWLLLV